MTKISQLKNPTNIFILIVFTILVASSIPIEALAGLDVTKGNSANSPFQGAGEKGLDFVQGFIDYIGPVIFLVACVIALFGAFMGEFNKKLIIQIMVAGLGFGIIGQVVQFIFF